MVIVIVALTAIVIIKEIVQAIAKVIMLIRLIVTDEILVAIEIAIVIVRIIILYQHRPQTVWAEIHGLNNCKLSIFRNAHCAISC